MSSLEKVIAFKFKEEKHGKVPAVELFDKTARLQSVTKAQNKNYYNTMYRINAQDINFFDKKILVPFGEYIPLRKFLPFIIKFTVGIEDFE